ncbi:MAG: hypothetical protein HY561_13540 [Gemmatimonadetes bacterium]|nr:hypothetical protein [Gemmatimonadota bacterium]
MAPSADRIRVRLNWIQILDKLEPAFEEHGEFRFTVRLSDASSGKVLQETKLPREAEYYAISDRPGWNRLPLDEVVFEGETPDSLKIELTGEELDFLSPNEQLDPYQRVFTGPPASWVGWYGPGDEGGQATADDPENLRNWRVCYSIERV